MDHRWTFRDLSRARRRAGTRRRRDFGLDLSRATEMRLEARTLMAGSISGLDFNDLTGAGSFSPGDPGLVGWTVDLSNAAGGLVTTTTTDANGHYSFPNVSPGSYVVAPEEQPGWVQTFPNPPGTYAVTLSSGQAVSGRDFGNFQLVDVTGSVYDDLNGNGNNDPGEPGLQGWTVDLLDTSGNVLATTLSDANGNYEFDGLPPGTFGIEEVAQQGWTQTQPVNPNSYEFATQSGLDETGLNFGNEPATAATVTTESVSWGTAGNSGPLVTQADGLRLLPAGRSTDVPWLGINRLTIKLSSAAALSASDVSVVGVAGGNYGPVTISGSGANYTITFKKAVTIADRVTVTIGNAGITTFTRRLDVLPGDVNDDGAVDIRDAAAARNQVFLIAPPTIFGDINGDGKVDAADYSLVNARIKTKLP